MNKESPPKLSLRFFRWYCHPDYLEDLEGDLFERYEKKVKEKSLRTAKWGFTKDVARLFKPGIIKPFFIPNKLSQASMFINNLKLGLRNLSKRKEYTFINTIGLAVGVASALLIFLYVQYQLSYDKSYSDSDRTYKMVQEISSENGKETFLLVPYSLVNILVEDYPEVETGTAISGPYSAQVVTVKNAQNQEIEFVENDVLLADSNFFKIFDLEMIHGDPATVLSEPNSVVLTERTAKRYFGDSNPIGKFISPSGKNSIVTGVCENPPTNSHLQFSYLVSSSSFGWLSQENFNLRPTHCYFKMLPGTNSEKLESKFKRLVEKYVFPEIERIQNISTEDYKKAGNGIEYILAPLTSIHLSEEKLGRFKLGGSIITVRILMITGVLILIIACINFMNLSTAKSTERAKEVGVRKVMGSLRRELITQFLTESFIISLTSLTLGTLFTLFSIPHFNTITGAELSLPLSAPTFGILLLASIILSLLAGLYPSFVLSSFSPIKALKGTLKSSPKGKNVMNGLVIFQFWIAILLTVCTLIIHKQVQLINEKDLGFNKEQVLVIEGLSPQATQQYSPFINAINDLPQVERTAGTLWVQGFQGMWNDNYRVRSTQEDFSMNRILIGDQYSEVMNFELIDGRLFSELDNDAQNILINESAAKTLGLKDPVGHKLIQRITDYGEIEEVPFTIKGVIKDFHYASIHEKIDPLIIKSNESNRSRIKYLVVKLKGGNIAKTIEQIENKWNETLAGKQFTFRFLDDTLNAKYKSEQQTATLLTLFSGLTIFIACLGLFALSSYMISIRVKEIGIRKVLGAKVSNITLLLSKDFFKLLALSFGLAIPAAWFVGNSWLDRFAYRIEIEAVVFLVAGLVASSVIVLTIGAQTLKAAKANPVDSIRDE